MAGILVFSSMILAFFMDGSMFFKSAGAKSADLTQKGGVNVCSACLLSLGFCGMLELKQQAQYGIGADLKVIRSAPFCVCH